MRPERWRGQTSPERWSGWMSPERWRGQTIPDSDLVRVQLMGWEGPRILLDDQRDHPPLQTEEGWILHHWILLKKKVN